MQDKNMGRVRTDDACVKKKILVQNWGGLLSTWPVTGANDKGPAFVHANARTLSWRALIDVGRGPLRLKTRAELRGFQVRVVAAKFSSLHVSCLDVLFLGKRIISALHMARESLVDRHGIFDTPSTTWQIAVWKVVLDSFLTMSISPWSGSFRSKFLLLALQRTYPIKDLYIISLD